MSLKVVIITGDNEYYKFLSDEMIKDNTYNMIIRVPTALFIENKLNSNSENLIIIDTDTVLISENNLSNVINKPNIVIIISSTRNSELIKFIKIGINNFILKPSLNSNYSRQNYLSMIKFKLNKTNTSKLVNNMTNTPRNVTLPQNNFSTNINSSQKIIGIASSTGGTEALDKIFRELPLDCPPILVVQHMPTGFTKLFADRLNNFCKPEIREAKDNDIIKKGLVLLAPADMHMVITKNSASLLSVKCFKGDKVQGVMPSADVLFESIASTMKDKSVGVILTGMGADGGKGIKIMHSNGSKTIGQNKETCVVYGMPKVAFELGAIDVELSICDICKKMLQYAL